MLFYRKLKYKLNSSKDIYRKINYLLKQNFFALEEIKELSFHQSYKIIKTILKINNIKLSWHKIRKITKAIRNQTIHKENKLVNSLFNKTFIIKKQIIIIYKYIINNICDLFTFRLLRQLILRI